MERDSITRIRQWAHNLRFLFNLLYCGGAVLALVLAVVLVIFCFVPSGHFTAEKGLSHWSLRVDLLAGTSFSSLVPFTILQPLNQDAFGAKTAFVTFLFAFTLVFFPAFCYVVKQLRDICGSIIEGNTPFQMQNVKRFKGLGWAMIGYSLASSFLYSILMFIFVTGIFSIQNINWSGLVAGCLALVMAEIFRYGVYLQEEHDTTL